MATRTLFKKNLILVLAVALLFLNPFDAASQLQINAINTTAITCPNNGIISINATTNVPPLLYSIISGPVTQPVQTNSVFTSMLPGNYVVKVSDGAGNELTAPATITGTYTNPDFTATTVKPYCAGESTGEITGTIVPGTGSAPFTWQMLAPSPLVVAPQNSSVFTNLPAGNYTMRVTDVCGGYKTSVITLGVPNTANPFYGGPIVNKIGCDTMNFYYKLYENDLRLPLTFKYETNGGVYTYTTATEMSIVGGFININQTVPNVDYGETVNITVYNACGDSTFAWHDIEPFLFYPSYGYNDCGTEVSLTFYNDSSLYWTGTGFMPPISYTVTDVATNTLVDQGSVNVVPPADITDTYINGFSTTSVEVGHTYQVSITDGCGDLFVEDYVIPAEAAPAILQKDCCNYACLDSVMGYRIHTVGFTNGQLIFLSGPSTLGSTKPGFEYSDTYTYPDTLNASGGYYLPQNLALGTYYFKVIDECGFEIFDSLVVSMVSNLTKEISYEKGCLGQNKIYYGAMEQAHVTVTNLSNNAIIAERDFMSNIPFYNRDSILNVASGQYEVLIEYLQTSSDGINDNIHDCWVIRDTIDIEPYQTPEMTAGNAIMCNNTINFVLLPDSTKGVPAYQYEIIAGPQTFPVQNSNVFTINQPGTYVARIYDVCGNASIKQITVDTISFEPISISTNCTSTSLVFPSSIYYTYEWILPSNQTYVGDSLILDPVTPADTGTYTVSKIININGCIDTLQTSFDVQLPHFLSQTIPFCEGTDVVIGNHTYNAPGIYNDTLVTSAGCDSLIVTNLMILPQNSDTTDVEICNGDSLQVGGQYYDLTGFYADSTQNTFGCYDLHVTHLVVNNIQDTLSATICPGGSYTFGGNVYQTSGFYADSLTSVNGCDSISILHLTALPYIQHAASVSICQDENYSFGGNLIHLQGIYIDTLSASNCDSIVTLTLTVLPFIQHAFSQTTCENYPYSFGGTLLSQSGIYTDTLQTSGCDSIVTLTLTVLPLKYANQTVSICEGESFSIGGNMYTVAGTYTDTILANASCDSIVTTQLIVLPLQHSDMYATICAGEDYPFGGTHYIHSGTYTHPFPTNSCDSIVTLHLTVIPAPSVNIVSSAYETNDGIFAQLQAISSTSPLDYIWTSSAVLSSYTIPNPTTTILNPTWVYVMVTDTNGCTSTDGYQILIPVTSTLYIPNTFTPNGDESNQVFRIYGTNIASFDLVIFDRWGEVIFESTDINYGWDATYKGKMVQDGTYVYKVSAVGMDYVNYEKTGHITVLK